MNFVRYAMSRIGDASETQISVSARAPRARPVPTVVAHLLVAACPKSILQRLEKDVMASCKSGWPTVPDSRVLPATTLAFAVRLKQAMLGNPSRIFRLRSNVVVMIAQKDSRKAANLSQSGIRERGNRGILPAPALTLAVWLQKAVPYNPRSILGYVFGKVWGMISVHKKFTFLVSKPRAFRDVAGHFLLGLHSFILPYLNEYGNAYNAPGG